MREANMTDTTALAHNTSENERTTPPVKDEVAQPKNLSLIHI